MSKIEETGYRVFAPIDVSLNLQKNNIFIQKLTLCELSYILQRVL